MRRRPWNDRAFVVFALVVACILVQKLIALCSWNWTLFDTRIYLDATRQMLDGAGNLYTGRFGDGWPFTYPPFAALTFAPLAMLASPLATALLLVSSVLALARICWLCSARFVDDWSGEREIGVGRTAAVSVVAALAFALTSQSDSVSGTLAFGQINLVIAWLVVEDYLGPTRRSGLLTGLAAGIKVTPALAAIPWLFTARRASAVRSLAVAAGTVLVALLVLPHQSVTYFTDALWDTSRPGAPESEWNQSLAGLAARIFHGSPVEPVAHWGLVALAVAAGVYASAMLLRRGDELGAVLAIFVTTGSASPISWYHHLVLVPLFCLWAIARPRRWPPRLHTVIVAQAFVLGVGVVAGVYQSVPRDNGAELHHSFGQTLVSELVPFLSLTVVLTIAAALAGTGAGDDRAGPSRGGRFAAPRRGGRAASH